MSEQEFREKVKSLGYSDEEIQKKIDRRNEFHSKHPNIQPIPFEDVPIFTKSHVRDLGLELEE